MSLRSLSKAKPKPNPKPPTPNLPQHELPEPYPRLMTLGREVKPEVYEAVAAQLKETDAQAGVAKLLEMTFDESFYEYYEGDDSPDGDPRGYTRVHALRALERMGEAAEIAIEPLMPLMNDEDDWISEEMPVFYGYMGRPAIEPLRRVLEKAGEDPDEEYLWGNVPRALAQIGQKHPELREEVIHILEQGLVNGANPVIAGFVVCSLLDVEAKESLEIIRQAFEAGRIDETIVDFIGVEESFGLREKRKWDIPRLLPPSLKPRGSSARNRFGETYQAPFVTEAKVGRNEPCPCGSGKKYKKCCGA